jgi:DNA-binding NarL/FixJ family response regulator
VPDEPIRVLVCDDQSVVRAGFVAILSSQPDITVLGEVSNGELAVREARRLRPDVLVMDIQMPVLDGIEATRQLVGPGSASAAEAGGVAGAGAAKDGLSAAPRVLIVTNFNLDEYVYRALQAGASGFMLKDAPPEEIAAAVRVVAGGDALLAPAITRAVIEEFTRRPPTVPASLPAAVAGLTPREREVLDLLARGLSNPQICQQLVISEATAKTHVARILQKLGLHDRIQIVIYAYETGLITPGQPARNDQDPR